MLKRTRSAAALFVAAGLLVAPAAAGAHDEDPGGEAIDERRAQSEDTALVAKVGGWSYSEAAGYLAFQTEFNQLAVELAETHPEQWAGAVFADRPGEAGRFRFTGEVPADVQEKVKRSGLPIELEGGARHSEQELRRRTAEVHRHLQKQGYPEIATAALPDDTIVATVAGGDKEPWLPDELRRGVRIEIGDKGRVAVDEHSRGGARMLDDGTFECTSAFAVETPGGTTGVATAAHCTGLNQYRQPEDGLTYGTSWQTQHIGWWGDMEWHTTTHLEPAQFYARDLEIRDVNSVTPPYGLSVNTWSCVYGRSSNNRACDQIYSTFVIMTTSSGTAFQLYAMDNDNTIPGDSGGPWSFATIADGIHKGDTWLGGGTRNAWSQVGLLPAAIGVSVQN